MLWEVGIDVRMLGNQMENQHLNFMQYSYGWSMICLHMGLLLVALQKGYQGCPCFAYATTGWWSNALRKVIYCGQHRRWLIHSHLYHQDARTFGGIEEVRPPTKLNVDDVYICYISNKGAWLQSGRWYAQTNLATQTIIKRLNALFQLEYWKVRNFANMDHIHIISFWVYCRSGSGQLMGLECGTCPMGIQWANYWDYGGQKVGGWWARSYCHLEKSLTYGWDLVK
jgi:hypothetical protein